jgi:hypothetical protein
MRSPRMTHCRPKKQLSLFSGPKNKSSLIGPLLFPIMDMWLGLGAQLFPINRGGQPGSPFLFLWESYRLSVALEALPTVTALFEFIKPVGFTAVPGPCPLFGFGKDAFLLIHFASMVLGTRTREDTPRRQR